jgi:hypothetical protein
VLKPVPQGNGDETSSLVVVMATPISSIAEGTVGTTEAGGVQAGVIRPPRSLGSGLIARQDGYGSGCVTCHVPFFVSELSSSASQASTLPGYLFYFKQSLIFFLWSSTCKVMHPSFYQLFQASLTFPRMNPLFISLCPHVHCFHFQLYLKDVGVLGQRQLNCYKFM